MKKILSILMILVLVGGVAFAQIELAPEGWAKLSWGVDLGSGDNAKAMHGFYNEHDLGIFIPFLYSKQSFKGGSADKKADVYADVSFKIRPSLKESPAFWLAPSASDISARLNFYGAYMTVYNKPSFASNKAWGWKPINHNANTGSPIAHWWFIPKFDGWGTKIGYENKGFLGLDVGLKIGSDGNWEGTRSDGKAVDTTNTDPTKIVPPAHSQYAMGVDFKMSPVEKLLDLDATFNVVFNKKEYKTNPLGTMMNFGFGVTSTPIDGMTIKAGFDGAAVNGFAWDAGLSAGYKWVEAAVYFGGKHKHADNKDFNMAAHFAFTSEEEGDTNFVKGLAFGAAVNAYNLLSDKVGKAILPLGLMANVSYKAIINDSMWVKPYAAFYAESNHGIAKDVFGIAYKAGVVYQPLEKVEVEAAWNHGHLNENTYEGGFIGNKMIKTPLNNKGHNGRFVLSLKLIY